MSRRGLLLGANALGAVAFAWPFILGNRIGDAARYLPIAWALVLPAVLLAAAHVLLGRQRDIREVTLMATLIALGAAVRPLGAGVAGLEPVWTVVLLSGRTLGARAGFLVGSLTLLVSALLTGGVGPWLPYQMMVAAWMGALPGILPALRGRVEIAFMTMLGALSGIASGALLNLWFWPSAVGLSPDISFVPDAGALVNLGNWLRYGALTSFGFDIPRAILTASLLGLATPSILPILRRATRRVRLEPLLEP